MKRLLLSAALMLLLLPALSGVQIYQPSNGSVAYAGRSLPGGRWCECGTEDCICDPGELPCTTCPNQGLTVQQNAMQESDPLNSIDLGTAFSLAVAAAVLMLRLRQI